ncbi:MAG: hypothetical protein N3A54_03455, partial [Patescibacteria group bacterium]|nr:hypothetical protein [Patescibacteria group bacterium]
FNREQYPEDELSDYVTVYRPFFTGNYSSLKEKMKIPYVRYILGNYGRLKEYLAKKKKITWREFLSYFIRPPIRYSYIKLNGDRATQEELSILKTPKQAAQEREAAERNKASKLNPQKTEEIDSGKLQKIEDKINSLNPEDVHAVVKKFRLESLARLALRCALEYADLPSVEIPKINLPSFDYKYDLQVKDPSGGMFNKLLEDLRTISFKTVLKQMKKFFSVEDCKDFKKFTQKKSWENFFVRLKEALIKDFNNYIEKIKNDLMELDEILSKTLCDPEVFVMSLYTSGVCLTPPETEQLLMGNLNTSKMVDFTNHVNRVSFMLGCENNYLLPEDVSVVFSTISRHFDKNIMPSYITPEEEEQEIYTETKIRCENAFDLYLNWLKDNGVTPEVIECLRETNTQEKSQIIEELYAYAEANGITELEKPIIVEDESSRKFLRNVFDVSVGKYLNNMATYVDLFSVFAGSKIAPSDFEDARQNLLNSFTLSSMKIEGASEETNNALKDNYISTIQIMLDLMDKSEVVSGAFTPYNVGENVISRGDVFWDLRYAYNTNAYKQVFSFTPMGYQFLLSLKNGEEVKITGSRQTAGLYYQSRTVTIGEKSYTSTFETPLIQKNKDLYEEIPNYRKKFSDLLWKDLPVAFNNPQVYGYFDHIFEKELYNFIQKKIADVFIEEMFRKSPIMCPFHLDGSNNATYGVELFLSFFRELTNIQGEENKEYLFLVDDWFERFYSLVMKDYKYSGVYKVEEHLKKILFRLKGRFYSFLFRLSTLPIVRFSKTDSNHFLVHYLLNTYPNFISEFLEEEEEHDFFKNLEMSNKIDEMFSGESSPIAEDLKFFLKNSLLSPTDNIGENAKREILKNEIPNNSGLYSSEPNYTMLEAQEVVKEEFQKASEMMSASLNKGAPISPVGGFLRSLRIRHFDGRVNYIVPSNIEQYYNNFSSQYSKFDLFLEAFYVDSDGETRNFALVSGGRRYSKDSNLYVQYNNKPMVYTTFMFDEEKMQKVPKFYFALSFAKYFVEPDNFFFGRDRFDIEYIIPILKVEVNPIEFYEFWVKNGNFSYDDKQKEEFLFDYLIKKLENDLYVQLYLRIVLGLDEIFDYCNIFLFEIMKKTTDISVLFDVKYDLPVPEESEEKALEQEIKEIEKYDNNSDLRSDAFGLLRRSLASSTIQKMALSMAEDTPKMIFKAFVEMTDKNIAAARYIVDNNRFGPPEKRKKLDIRFVSLVLLLPSNLWPPPYGIGPPITPLGMMYLAIEDKLKPNKKKKEENKENVEQILQNVEDVVNEEELYYLNILREVCYNCFCYKEEDKEEIIDQVEKSCFV